MVLVVHTSRANAVSGLEVGEKEAPVRNLVSSFLPLIPLPSLPVSTLLFLLFLCVPYLSRGFPPSNPGGNLDNAVSLPLGMGRAWPTNAFWCIMSRKSYSHDSTLYAL